MNYWYCVYGVGIFKPKDANEIEFNITDDQEGEKRFFHFDLYNLPALKRFIANELEKTDDRYDVYVHQYLDLRNYSIDFWIDYLYFDEEEHCEGYDYLPLNSSKFETSVFEIKNKRKAAPFYGSIFIAEPEPLLPDKVIQWIESLSGKLFSEQIQLQFAEIPIKEDIIASYQEYARVLGISPVQKL